MERADFPDAFDRDITVHILKRFMAAPLSYLPVFNERTIDGDHYNYTAYSTFQSMPAKTEGAAYGTDDPLKRYTATVTPSLYGLAFKSSIEFVEDQNLNLVQRWAESLADSAADRLNQLHAYILINAFATVTYGDTKVLCTTDHPTAGGTEQNELTVAADLSTSSLNEARYTMRRTVDHRGKLLNLSPDKLIVPPELEKLADEIIGSPQASGTANNDKNFFAGRLNQLVVIPQLTDSDAWFIQSPNHLLQSVKRLGFTPGSYLEQSSDSLVHKARMRYTATAEGWRGIFGSPGAA